MGSLSSAWCFFLFLHITFEMPDSDVTDEDFDCPTNIMLVENGCNKCFCTSNGELACTIRECPENKNKGLEDCEDGTSWHVGCNKCWCIPIGTVCTNKTCNTHHII